MESTTKVFVMVPNYWGTGASLEEAFKQAWRAGGPLPSKAKRGTHFALEFPASAHIRVGEVHGDWQASEKPLRVLSHKGLKPEQVERMEALCK